MKRRSFISLLIITTLLLSIVFHNVTYAQEYVSINQIDDFLRNSDTPEYEISRMDDELKRMVFENSGSDPELKYIEIDVDSQYGSERGYGIPENDLELSVFAFAASGNTVDIYPSYEWKVPVRPRGKDYFGYSTHSDYSVVPGQRSNLIWYKMDAGDNWRSDHSATYTSTQLTGYEHSGKSLGTPDFPIYIKGNFYFKVDMDNSNPVNKIVLSYVHDRSWGGSFSYSIGYGPASISVTPSSSNVGYQNNAYWLNH